MNIREFIHEARTGWHQGVINRAEERAAKSVAVLAALSERPHRPGDCSACRRRKDALTAPTTPTDTDDGAHGEGL